MQFFDEEEAVEKTESAEDGNLKLVKIVAKKLPPQSAVPPAKGAPPVVFSLTYFRPRSQRMQKESLPLQPDQLLLKLSQFLMQTRSNLLMQQPE